MQQLTDPYRALGVSFGATDAEIKAAHRKLVKRYHPDTGTKSEPERFLRVQEAYRVLSDPLLRKEWDLKHAPGPIRADRSAGAPPATRRRKPAPQPAPPNRAHESEPADTPPPPRQRPETTDPRSRPRSSRAYTWSASEVPWWEESRERKQAAARQKQQADAAGPTPGSSPPPNGSDRDFAQQDFDVYNRSSGAAWSSAARAYFRKGDADLPKRGSFHHQGTQSVTAGRARAAAEAEARRRAAAAAAAAAAAHEEADVYASPRTQAHAAPGPREGTTHIVRRSLAAPWPSLVQRFGLALLAWIPIAALVSLAAQSSGDELMGLVLTVASLVFLLTFPRLAYIAAVSTVLALSIGGLFLGGILLSGGNPSPDRLLFYVGALLMVGYIATSAAVVIGPASLRPWSAR